LVKLKALNKAIQREFHTPNKAIVIVPIVIRIGGLMSKQKSKIKIQKAKISNASLTIYYLAPDNF